MIVSLAFSMLSFPQSIQKEPEFGVPHFIWRVQVRTTPSKLRELVPLREVRKLYANYA